MKTLSLTFFLALICSFGFAQNKQIDRLKHQLDHERQDTNRVAILLKLHSTFWDSPHPDSSKAFAERALDLASKINYPKGEFEALSRLMNYHRTKGDTPKALSYGHKAMRIAEDMHDHSKIGEISDRFAMLYMLNLMDYRKAESYLKKSIQEFETLRDTDKVVNLEIKLSSLYRRTHQFDAMLIYQKRAYAKYERFNNLDLDGLFFMILGANHAEMGNYPLALPLLQKGVFVNHKIMSYYQEVNCLQSIATIYKELNQLDSTIFYEKRAIEVATRYDYKQQLIISYKNLADIYEAIDKDTAYHYQKMAWDLNESINGAQKIIALEKTIVEEQERQQKEDIEKIDRENRLKQYILLAGLGIMFLIGFMLYRNNKKEKKAKVVLENTLSKLKATQNQLIQSEKLASLGELTAGIAHEIQNPLNFVNNFAEMSVSLANDLNEEIKNSPLTPDGGIIIKDKEYFEEIISDLTQNQEKINLHGKRAASIVTGMLQHSQASSGKKELTDINKLADESLRLSYHGLRAKDKNGSTPRFNSDFELISDPNLPKINVIPQDIGRVLINLINNAFQSSPLTPDGGIKRPLKVIVSTKYVAPPSGAGGAVVVSVTDNGTGMSEATKAKIFQPFFTTKPTGQGTGLGLSLAYNIITKGHGGTIECESIEGEGTTFIVKLPLNN